jgi:predicted Na+-dependent transporter
MLKYENNHYVLTQKITVAIKRHQTIIDILFTGVVIFLVTVGTLCIGCGLEIEQLMTNFKRPIPLIVGLFCQIIYLPLLSFGITKLFRLDHSTSLGLISTASSPGKIFYNKILFKYRKRIFFL